MWPKVIAAFPVGSFEFPGHWYLTKKLLLESSREFLIASAKNIFKFRVRVRLFNPKVSRSDKQHSFNPVSVVLRVLISISVANVEIYFGPDCSINTIAGFTLC